MAPPHPDIPPAAEPARKIFDRWNSSSTGHQRAENRLAGGTSWRASRTIKLAYQFNAGAGGGKRLYDTVGAGSKDFGKDGRKENGGWEKGAPGLREDGWQDVRGLLGHRSASSPTGKAQQKQHPTEEAEVECRAKTQIFRDLCVYINGSTAPMVSDHKLKQLLAQHGARVSIALGRRSVTHVILGTPNGATGGAGGGLAAWKLQKEIKRVGGCGVKYVGVEWALESIRAGKRLPEARFSNMSIAGKNQKSVYGLFKKPDDPEASAIEKPLAKYESGAPTMKGT